MTDMENYQTLEMAGPLPPVKKNIQQSVENRNKTYHQKASRYDKYKFPNKNNGPHLNSLKINLDDSTDGRDSDNIAAIKRVDDYSNITRNFQNKGPYGLQNISKNSSTNQVSHRSSNQQNPGVDEMVTPRSQPKLKLKIRKSKMAIDKPNLQGSSQAPNFMPLDPNEINQQMNGQSLLEDDSPKALGDRISTFDADAMEADTDLLLGDLMNTDAINQNTNLPVRNFEGTLASHILQDNFQDTSLIGDQNFDLRDPEGILDNEEFDKDEYDTNKMEIDEGEVGDRQVQQKNSLALKKQLTDIQSKIQNKMKQQQAQVLMGSTYLKSSKHRNSLVNKNDNINLDKIKGMSESMAALTDSPLRKINQNLVDYKIVYINIGSGNEQELRISPKSFEFIPRDLLQYLGKWSKQFVNGVNEQNIVSLDLAQNNIQEIEGSLFMHLGKEGCQNIKSIKAHKNHIKYVSARIKDCVNLQTLKLSDNQLTGREFLPTEVLNSTNFCASLEYLYLANNDIRELPIQLNSLRNLKVLNLEHNKIRTLSYKQNTTEDEDDEKQQIVCSISGLESLEELYLGQNRLKDLPTVFHNFRKLKILGLDWFTYIAQPLTLPKIVEDQNIIQKLKNTCHYNKEEKKNQYITFRQFAKGFTETGKYNIDGGQKIQEDGRTSLHLAVLKNDQAMVNNLLKDGSDPNLLDIYQYSPLGLALSHNLINISKLILKFSQKINFKTAENSRLLLLSVEKLDIDLTEELLRQGCDPNLSQDIKSGENCLHLLVFKLSCANENVLIRAENTIQEEKHSQSESKLKDQTPIMTERDGKNGHLKTHGEDPRYGIGLSDTKQNTGFGDTSIYFNDHKKCLRILDSLLLHGMNVNQQCNQKYTPFLLAVRLGNVFLTQKLLQRLVANSKVSKENNNGGADPNRQIDLDLKGGYGLNTAYHLAATRTNFDILYELDKFGADIYARNKENKTAFQLVNNNLLMLKIVKKIEKKQVIQHHILLMDKISPPECKIVVHNNIYVNTCEYKQFDETLQKLKRENNKSPQDRRRTSLFSGQKRGSSQGGSLTRLQMDQQSSKRSNVHKHHASVKTKPKKLYLFDFLSETEKEYEKPVKKQQTREEIKESLFRMDLSPKDSDRIKLSLQLNNGKIPQNMPKIKNMTLNENKSSQVIKLNNLNLKALNRIDSADIIETDRFAFGNSVAQNGSSGKKNIGDKPQNNKVYEREKKTQSKFNNWSQSEIQLGDEKINLNLNNYNNYNKAVKKVVSSKTSQEKVMIPINLNASQRIDSLIAPPTPFGLKAQQISMVYPYDDKNSTKVMFNQNHKNIFFIKDQLFDKERIKQINNNLNVQICYCQNDKMYIKKKHEKEIKLLQTQEDEKETSNLESTQLVGAELAKKKDDREVLEYQILPLFRDAINFGIQGNRQVQEIKLISQLKSIFNPKLKTHINVLSEIIEKLYKMKQSKFIIIQILEMSASCLQVIEFTKQNTNLKDAKLEIRNRQAQYGFITIRAALENLQQNINCPCWMQEEIQEVIQTNQLPVKRPTIPKNREDITITEANDEPYNIFPITSRQNLNDSQDDEFSDALPSQHMMKYSKINTSEKKLPTAPTRTQHFNGPVKLMHPNKRVGNQYYQGAASGKEGKKQSIFGNKKNSHQSNYSHQLIDLNNKITTKTNAFSSRKNSMIHHKNKNPLTQFPNSPEKDYNNKTQTIETSTLEKDGEGGNTNSQPHNQEQQTQITLAQIRDKQKRINDVYKRFDDEFNKNMTIEQEAEQRSINNSPKKVKLKSFDPEETQTQQLSSMVNLTSFQKAKFNSNKHAARASDLAETELLVNHFEKQSVNASMTDRVENSTHSLLEEQKDEKVRGGENEIAQDTIVVKRKNINFKRLGTAQGQDEKSNQKLTIKIKNTDGTTSKGSKKLPKTISSKKLNIQNIQSTQFIPSSKNSPREPGFEKHQRKSSRIDEITVGVAKFQEIKKSETNLTKLRRGKDKES